MAGVAGSSSDAHLSTSAAAPREKRRHSGGSQFQFSQCVTCPICEKSFSIHKIEAHASRCAERSGVVAAARRSHKKKKCKTRAGAAAVVTIDVNMIDGYEFRSQTALEALGPEAGAPDEVPTLHPPAPVSAPAPSLRLKGVARQGAAPPVLLSWGRGTSSHGAARPSLPAPAASGSSEAAVLDAEVIRRRAAVLDAACPAPDPPAASPAGQSALFPAGRGAGRRPSAPGCRPSGAAPARAPAPAGVEVADVTPEGYAFKVAEALSGDPATLKSFVQTMKAFEEGRAGTVEVMRDVSACLANHRPLLAQFNAFLPKGYRVEALPRTLSAYAACIDDPGSITQEAAVGLASSFVERLCARYANRPRKLEQMHALLAAMPFDEPLAALTPQSCTRMPSGALGLCRSFGPLLSDEPDLLREFMQYVPPSCTATQHIHLVPLPER